MPLAGVALYFAQPDFAHLPEAVRPHRPLAVAAINGVGGALV